jgi:hypothetical protein
MKYLILKKTGKKLTLIKIYKYKKLYYCKDEEGVEYMIHPDKIEFDIVPA